MVGVNHPVLVFSPRLPVCEDKTQKQNQVNERTQLQLKSEFSLEFLLFERLQKDKDELRLVV